MYVHPTPYTRQEPESHCCLVYIHMYVGAPQKVLCRMAVCVVDRMLMFHACYVTYGTYVVCVLYSLGTTSSRNVARSVLPSHPSW